MKKALFFFCLFISFGLSAQTGIGTTTPNASAKLDVFSSNKGFLPPRVTLISTSDATTISSPVAGLLIYNTATAGTSPNNVTPGYYYFDGTKWQRLINPQSDVLQVNGIGGGTTGLRLPTGAAAGSVLTSDGSGNASWQTSNAIVYTEVHCNANSSFSLSSGTAFDKFNLIKADNVVSLYGSNYGWNNTLKRWVAPFTGKYRITTNVYFNYNASYVNPRVYAYQNNTAVCNITSASSNGSDMTSATSAIIQLSQGDYINWKVMSSGAAVYCGEYHTFMRIESVGQ